MTTAARAGAVPARRWRPWQLAVAVIVALGLVATTCSLLGSDDEASDPSEWFTPLWDGSAATYGDICTKGVCVADLVALPQRRPVEATVDLAFPETLGALSVERIWTGERSGLFGSGWESVWDVRLVDGRLTGPIPAVPAQQPKRGNDVALADGSTLGLDDEGRVERVCADGARCVEATRTATTIALRAEGSDDEVTFTLDGELVTEAADGSGRRVTYGYDEGRLATVEGETSMEYTYDAGGRLTGIDDGVPREFAYDARVVTSAVDRDGRTWTITSNDDEYQVTGDDSTARTYRFSEGELFEVDDSELGPLVRRTISNGVITAEDRPLDGVSNSRLEDGRLRIEQQRPGAPARVATLTMDELGRVTHSESAEGTTVIHYEGRSSRPSEVERNGESTSYTYDDHGLLVRTVDADDYQVDIERNDRGLPVKITDGVLAHHFVYDEAGRVVAEGAGASGADAARATATYDPGGRLAKLTNRAGESFDPKYDEGGRLTALGDEATPVAYDASGAVTPESADRLGLDATTVPQADPAEIDKLGDEVRYTYASGDQAIFDDAGRLLTLTVDGRTTTRTYDDAGRLATLELPDGQTYTATYTDAGRLKTISDGKVTAELTWHGDLLTEATTTVAMDATTPEGSQYRYQYDEAGNLTQAAVGALRWDYEYDARGLVSAVRRPAGVSRYEWDDLGRPTRTVDGSMSETYQWEESDFALAEVRRNDEIVLAVDRETPGRVSSVTGPDGETSSFTYDEENRVTSYTLPGDTRAEVSYDAEGRVAEITSGGRTERWTWSDGAVSAVEVEGDDDGAHRLEWLAPGILAGVTRGDETLLTVDADERGRVTTISSDGADDPVATFSWVASGLAAASFDGWKLSAFYDPEHRPTAVLVGDVSTGWTYENGALTGLQVGDESLTFDYHDETGRLATTHMELRDGSDEAESDETRSVAWDANGAKPVEVTTPAGQASFAYGDGGTVVEITAGDATEAVSYEDIASAPGDAGAVLNDLFTDRGLFATNAVPSLDSPWAPWFDHLPADFGLALPDVVTGEDVVATATAEVFPQTPMPLIPEGDLAEHTARQVIGMATSTNLPAGPDRFLAMSLGPDGGELDDLLAASPTSLVVGSVARHLGPEPGYWERATSFGGDLLGRVVDVGGAVWSFLTDNQVGRAVLSVTFMASAFVVGVACGITVACHVAAAVGFLLAEGLLAMNGDSMVATLTSAAMAPLEDLRAATDGDPTAILSSAALVVGLVGGALSMPLARVVPARALAPACNLRRMVCVSVSRYGAAAEHVVDAQRNGAARVLQVDRPGAQARRNSALRGTDSRAGFDRDEYPFAVSSQRDGLSIRYIDPTSNRALGSYVGNQLSPLPDGARFFVLPIA